MGIVYFCSLIIWPKKYFVTKYKNTRVGISNDWHKLRNILQTYSKPIESIYKLILKMWLISNMLEMFAIGHLQAALINRFVNLSMSFQIFLSVLSYIFSASPFDFFFNDKSDEISNAWSFIVLLLNLYLCISRRYIWSWMNLNVCQHTRFLKNQLDFYKVS